MRPLSVVGNINVDLVMGPFAPWPEPGNEVLAETDAMRPGGAAGNTALAWEALGVPHQVGGNVGNDLFGTYLRDAFPRTSARWPTAPMATMLSVGITHPDGERTFFTTRGHMPDLTPAKVMAMLDADTLRGGLLLLCGSFLTPALTEGYDTLFDWADAHEIDVALDTGWPPGGWTETAIAEVRHWLSRSRHVLLNEAEATALAGRADAVEAARALADLLPAGGVIVVKRGPRGAMALAKGGDAIEVPGEPVMVIDTVGAGDVFNAGYLLGIAEGKSTADALRLGVEVASIAISTEPRVYARPDPRAEEGMQ